MQHIFIVNPAAGAADSTAEIAKKLEAFGDNISFVIYTTKYAGDGSRFVSEYCGGNPEEELRFYACGGDGTLNEVVSGVYGHKNASVTCYSCGSGNDYIKYYGTKDVFTNLDELIHGCETTIDLIRVNNRVGINAAHFGFDSVVADKITDFRRKPLIGGKNAYKSAVIYSLIKSMKTECTVRADGEVLNSCGKLLLCTAANGKYVGGSYKCAPRSSNSDGLLEVCLVLTVTRLVFLKLVKDYAAGNHLDNPKFEKYITYRQARRLSVDFPGNFVFSLDGEIMKDSHFDIEILPGALRFAVPASVAAVMNII